MKEISSKDLKLNPFEAFPNEWFALGAGNEKDGYSAMAISWGHFGAIYGHDWGQPSVVIYVRPQRRTRYFVDKEEEFSLSLLDASHKKSLLYLGQHSGGDAQKITDSGLHPSFDEKGNFFIKEAKVVLICKKIYRSQIKEENFIDKGILTDHYPSKDYHYVYIANVVKTLVSE